MLFEPRYLALARAVLGSQGSANDGDGRYAHVDASNGHGTITTIQMHRWLPDGRVAIQCLGGPRIRSTKARLEPLPPSRPDAAAPSPLLHVEYAIEEDEATEDATADAVLARDCLERLCALAPLDREPSARANLPPLLCAERLSFWLCQLLLRNDDTDRRRDMLKKRSTYERLCFVSDLIDRASKRPADSEQPGDSSGFRPPAGESQSA